MLHELLSRDGTLVDTIIADASAIVFFFMGYMSRVFRMGQARAEGLVAELEASRDAQAQAVTLRERQHLARELHDVLAHSLSALAVQLEGTRLLARSTGADRSVIEAVERSHHLAKGGLEEARRAIEALRGGDMPGPDRLPALADQFREQTGVETALALDGEPRELPSEARLAVYRTAQEALTNVRRHADAERVDLRQRRPRSPRRRRPARPSPTRLVLPSWFLPSLGVAIALQIATTAVGVGDGALWVTGLRPGDLRGGGRRAVDAVPAAQRRLARRSGQPRGARDRRGGVDLLRARARAPRSGRRTRRSGG